MVSGQLLLPPLFYLPADNGSAAQG